MGLFTTTIRYAGTNEVACVNNASIAQLRIVNCNRSPNGIFVLQLPYKLSMIDDDKIPEMRAFLDSFVKMHPNEWHSVLYCRVADIDYRKEMVEVVMGIQSRYAWQDLGRIATAKAKLRTAIYEFGRDANLNYDELPTRELLYDAGRLREGSTLRHRSMLHQPSNVVSNNMQETSWNSTRSNFGLLAKSSESSGSKDFLSMLQDSHQT